MLNDNAGQPRGTPRSVSPDICFTCHEAWQKICPRVQLHSSTGAIRDVDLLGFGDAAADALLGTFREIMAVEVDDGVSFDLKGLRIEAIREELEYGGSRIRTTAALAGARIPITVDIGFGDAVEPGVEDIDLPVLLDMPSPHLRAYPPET